MSGSESEVQLIESSHNLIKKVSIGLLGLLRCHTYGEGNYLALLRIISCQSNDLIPTPLVPMTHQGINHNIRSTFCPL